MTQSPVQLDLGSATMNCTAEEIAATLASLLNEMRLVIPRLREDERDLLRQIMSRDSGTLRVADVFPDFARESEGHKTLRRLRAAQFVRPERTGRWDPDEPIEIKPFARLMWDHIGEDAIFAGAQAVPMAAPADDVVDLTVDPDERQSVLAATAIAPQGPEQEDVLDLRDMEEEKPVAPDSSRFEADNLDLGDYDELCAYAEEELRGKR